MPDATVETSSTPARLSLRTKFLLASILPTVLAVAFALGAILLTVPGALRASLLESARNPAVALAGGIEGLVPTGLMDTTKLAGVQKSLSASRATFRAQNIEFVIVTDANGNPLAGWYGNDATLTGMPDETRSYVQTQAGRARARAYMETHQIPLGDYNPPSRLVSNSGAPIEIAGAAISHDGETIGATVVGISSENVSRRVQGTVLTTLAASTLPVILAIALAGLLASSITRNILSLVHSADRISLGDLEAPVVLKTNDELSDLGQALERMRVSLQESLERLRRRRR